MKNDKIVEYVIASARLEGQTLSDETVAVIRQISSGEMTPDENRQLKRKTIDACKREAVRE